MAFTLSSPSFEDGAAIPGKHTADGDNVAPALKWSDAPEGTKSFVLIVDDPDAPDPAAPRTTWVHWVLFNLPPGTTSLPEGAISADLPFGTLEGVNDWKRTGYGGPDPPVGRHRYFLKLYALDAELPLLDHPTKGDVEKAMAGHVLAEARLMGTYQKRP
jgi:Raf kinase inhibitor-like YbhB/YbcL family protein